jgi:hypothetical protein
MIEIKSFKAIRCGTIAAVLYAIFGLFEALFTVSLLGLAPSSAPNAMPPLMKPFFGIGAFILFPILFAIGGFISGALSALLYNFVVRWTGGLQVRVEQLTEAAISPS